MGLHPVLVPVKVKNHFELFMNLVIRFLEVLEGQLASRQILRDFIELHVILGLEIATLDKMFKCFNRSAPFVEVENMLLILAVLLVREEQKCGVRADAILGAKQLTIIAGTVDIAHIQPVLVLAVEFFPHWLHFLAVTTPRRRKLDEPRLVAGDFAAFAGRDKRLKI
jgi:hypothetical protein